MLWTKHFAYLRKPKTQANTQHRNTADPQRAKILSEAQHKH